MSNPIRSLGALTVAAMVFALGACSSDEYIYIVPPDCSGVGALGPQSRTVPVNTLVELEIELVKPMTVPMNRVSWSLRRPQGSFATLDILISRPASTTNSFTPDVPGEYTVSRTVEFAECGEFSHTATITAVEGPVADASATQLFWDVGSTVTLDGSASSANVVSWTWEVVNRSNSLPGVAIPPNGSGETFTFVLDEPNIIEYELIVSNGSLADTTRVTVRSNPPTISDVTPRSGAYGHRVVIDGTNFSPTASYLHNKVTFNGVEASFVSASSASVNRLEVYAPPNVSSGPVLVEVRGTGDVALGPVFTVITSGTWVRVRYEGEVLLGIHAVDQNIATAVGNVILRTVNGGQDWTVQTVSAGNLTLQDVQFIDANTGYAVGWSSLTYGLVLRTTNGGQQWDIANGTLNEAAAGNHMGVAVIDANTAITIGNNTGGITPRILRTTDGGASWADLATDPDIPTHTSLQDIFFFDADVGFVVGRNEVPAAKTPLILRTSDGGGNWTLATVPASLTYTTLNAVHFADASNGWAVGRGSRDGVSNSAIILHTQDGGFTWTEQGVGQVGGDNTSLLDVFFTDNLTGWIVSEGPPNLMVYNTEDGGTTWTREFEDTGSYVGGEQISFGGTPAVGYLVNSNGLIWRRQ